MSLPPALATRAGLLTCLAYGTLFAALGAHLPYWPVWLRDWGLSTAEVGRWLAAALAVRIVSTTVVPLVADRIAQRRLLATALALAAALNFVGHLWIEARGVLFAATLLTTALMSPLIPLGEALGLRATLSHGFAYAQARAVGSAAFLASAVGVGWLVERLGAPPILFAVAAGLAAFALFAAIHPGGGAPPGRPTDRARLAEAARLAVSPVFLVFAVAASVGQASHAIFYGYGTLIWSAQGIPADRIGLLWATGVAAETGVMLGVGAVLTARLGAPALLAIGTGAGVLRWSLLALEPPLWALWPLQTLHALTFGIAHLGAMAFVAAAIPPRLVASASGLFAGGLGGIAMAATTLAAAEVVERQSPGAAYWLATALSAVAFAAALALSRLWQGGRIAALHAAA